MKLPAYQHHLCFVSDQNVAELLGALLLGRPHIHALVTPKMRPKAAALEQTCRRHKVPYTLHELAHIDLAEIEQLLDAIWLKSPNDSWAVNITGGTKLMSIAAYGWAAKNKVPAFYVDTAAKTLQLCEGNRWQAHPLPDVLGFESLLSLYGYEVTDKVKAAVDPAARQAVDRMIDLLGQRTGAEPFHALNERAHTASAAPDLAATYTSNAALKSLLGICKAAGKLDFTRSSIIFKDEAARQWCNGVWLEEYARAVLARLESEGRITSWAATVRVVGDAGANELDAIFTANNCLYVLECKTSRIRTAATSVLYKADSLRGRVGGIFTKSMLCSLGELSADESKRAATLGIKTVVGGNLKNLRKILIEWMGAA